MSCETDEQVLNQMYAFIGKSQFIEDDLKLAGKLFSRWNQMLDAYEPSAKFQGSIILYKAINSSPEHFNIITIILFFRWEFKKIVYFFNRYVRKESRSMMYVAENHFSFLGNCALELRSVVWVCFSSFFTNYLK